MIARHLQISYELPVYALGVFPARSEVSLHTMNAVESLKTLQTAVDNTLVFSNDVLTPSGKPTQESYTQLNREIARRVQMICAASAPDTVADTQTQPQQVVDASEVIRTLDHGTTSTIGFAATTLNTQARTDGGVLSRISNVFYSQDDPPPAANPANQGAAHAIKTLTRKAVLRSTPLTDQPTARSALLLVSGPPDELDRAGLGEAQSWLSDDTGTAAVRTGDLPVANSTLCVLVLLSGVATPLSRWIDQRAVNGLPSDGTDAVAPLFD
ncbi:MAG: cell division GTPase [halophilic archaeon J07HX5]|nr:MAG: cell division GTPase [halophilic archaeon J07HX5]